ncbi:MAG: glycosyltransferase family 1 protein [Bacteroidota bacterium]
MRIAFLADPLDRQYGGIHVYTKELLKALSKVDKKNEYFVIRSERKNEFEGIEEIVVPYLSFPGYRFWRLFFQLPKILVKKGVDIVVEPAHFGPFNLPKRIKRITVIHDMTVFLYPELHVFLSQYLQRKLLPGILKRSNHIITNSTHTTDDVVNYFPFVKNKISSTLLGKDKSFKPRSDKKVLEKYTVGQPYILFVGTLEPRKNIPVLIAAFNEFKQQTGMAHQLVLVGKKGWKSKDIFQAINGSPFKTEIVWLGYVDKEELPIFYSMAEVFVYPSVYEGFGLPILEAMACGTPVITSNSSSLPEVGGSAVMYANPKSAGEIAQRIISLCSNSVLREKFSQLGLSQSAQFSWEKTAWTTIQLFEHLNEYK